MLSKNTAVEKRGEGQRALSKRINLFKKRKKSSIRPFVKEARQRNHTKAIRNIFIASVCIILFSGTVFAFRELIVPLIASSGEEIVNPQGSPPIGPEQVEKVLRDNNIEYSDVIFFEGLVTMKVNGTTDVVISLKKDIKEQLILIDSIDKEVKLSGKQAISIDLRYNKPIVKF